MEESGDFCKDFRKKVRNLYNPNPLYSICLFSIVKNIYKRGANTSSQHQAAGEKEGG